MAGVGLGKDISERCARLSKMDRSAVLCGTNDVSVERSVRDNVATTNLLTRTPIVPHGRDTLEGADRTGTKVEKLALLVIMFAAMFQARWLGVPVTLAHPPMLWLPVGRLRALGEERSLQRLEWQLDELLVSRILKVLLFRKRRCLAKGLVLAWYAKKWRSKAILHFGVRLKQGAMKGHCWVSFPCVGENAEDYERRRGNFLEIWSVPLG